MNSAALTNVVTSNMSPIPRTVIPERATLSLKFLAID